MVFSELPAGTNFYMGKFIKKSWRSGSFINSTENFRWTKTAKNGLSILQNFEKNMKFDNARTATGSNNYVKQNGHRLFTLTILHQYLNCDDRSFIEQVAPGDDNWQYEVSDNENGFLSYFSSEELSFLEPFERKIDVPTGYNKKYGNVVVDKALVSLPTFAELGSGYGVPSVSSEFNVPLIFYNTWVLDADTLNTYWSCGRRQRKNGSNQAQVHPIVKIKDDAPVDQNSSGLYFIRKPEELFEGNILDLLGFTALSA